MAQIIDYKGVEITRGDLSVLRSADCALNDGAFVSLIGQVGSGKSSLLKTMYAEIPVSAGEAHILGYDLTALRRRDVPMLRRQIGIVFQDFQLLTDRSVYDNLLFVLKATGWKNKTDIDDRINEVLSQVDMTNKSYKMPHELSGGEQQRIAIARALLNNPSLILADEPTGNLDEATGEQIMRLLHDISSKGTAVIMATHNMKITQDFPARIVRCEAKKILEV